MIKFNPRLYFRSVLCGWRNTDKCFCRPTHLRMRQKTATIFNHRLYYLANTTSRCEFWTKHNLWLTLVLVFSDFNKLSNLLYYKQRQVVVQPMVVLCTRFQFLTQTLLSCKTRQHSTYGWIQDQFCVDYEMWINIFYAPTYFPYIPENSGQVQPRVVFCFWIQLLNVFE